MDFIQCEDVRTPFWSAYQKFGWPPKEWGISIKEADLQKAEELGIPLRIPVSYFKKTYEISPVTARNFGSANPYEYKPGHVRRLWCIPGGKLKAI